MDFEGSVETGYLEIAGMVAVNHSGGRKVFVGTVVMDIPSFGDKKVEMVFEGIVGMDNPGFGGKKVGPDFVGTAGMGSWGIEAGLEGQEGVVVEQAVDFVGANNPVTVLALDPPEALCDGIRVSKNYWHDHTHLFGDRKQFQDHTGTGTASDLIHRN